MQTMYFCPSPIGMTVSGSLPRHIKSASVSTTGNVGTVGSGSLNEIVFMFSDPYPETTRGAGAAP